MPFHMRRSSLALALALFPALLRAQDLPVIRVDVNLVRVLATAKNPAGEAVGALEKSDFEIYDNGAKQEIAVFERQTAQPLSVAVLIDTSGSTAKELKYEIDSVSRFLKALFGNGDRRDMAALYSFNWRVTREQNFTPNHPPLESALRKLKGEAGTALYDAIYLAAQDLEDRDGRHVMVIVTDGGDTTSVIDSHKALAAAHMSDAVIYPVVVLPITNDAGRNIGGENVLTFMAQGTGGRTFLPTVGAQLDKAFTDIINDLRTQYMIGFYPKDAPLTRDRFHKLEVRLTRPELRVSARNGYYGEAEGAAGSPGARITVDPGSTVKRRQQK